MAGQFAVASFSMDSAQFKAALEEAVASLKLNGNRALDVLGIEVQNRARTYCPVKTGRLRASILSVPGDDAEGHYVDVGTNVVYARRIEFGFVGTDSLGRRYNQGPQPYLRPALLEATGWAPKEIAADGA